MIDGLGQKGGLQFSMPDLSNLAMAFDFGALLAEAENRSEMPQMGQHDFDERDDGLGYCDGNDTSELRADAGRDNNEQRLDKHDNRDRKRAGDNKRTDQANRKQDGVSSTREAGKSTTDTVQRQGSVTDLSDAQRGNVGGDRNLSHLANQMT